jgi:hypothetical protein
MVSWLVSREFNRFCPFPKCQNSVGSKTSQIQKNWEQFPLIIRTQANPRKTRQIQNDDMILPKILSQSHFSTAPVLPLALALIPCPKAGIIRKRAAVTQVYSNEGWQNTEGGAGEFVSAVRVKDSKL